MNTRRFARGDVLFKEGDPADCVFRLLAGDVEIVREIGGHTILMGTVTAGQFLGEMGVVEERARRSATARAGADLEAEMLAPTEFLDQLNRSPGVARDLIRRLSQRLHAAERNALSETKRDRTAATPWYTTCVSSPEPPGCSGNCHNPSR